MLPRLTLEHRSWPLATPFRISRGVRTSAEVVMATVRDGDLVGRGEAVPYPRYGESVESVIAEGMAIADTPGLDRDSLQRLLPPGAARNAIDCALWDLQAQRERRSVAAMLGHDEALPPLVSAFTVGLDTPEAMAAAARTMTHLDLVKIKVDANDPAAQIRAVRAELPKARLIVDPNEAWTFELLQQMQPVLAEARIDLIEQPLPAGADDVLEGFASTARLCADESCHVASDLPKLRSRYQVVNIKLDKTGGLTGALELLKAAQADGFGIMVGCMICPSMAIAPAWHVARAAEFVDLDGPLWLKDDHPHGARLDNGLLLPAGSDLWGTPRTA